MMSINASQYLLVSAGICWEALGKQSLPREHRSREERPGLCDLRMYPYKKGEAEGT
jgi:hypothetical protein